LIDQIISAYHLSRGHPGAGIELVGRAVAVEVVGGAGPSGEGVRRVRRHGGEPVAAGGGDPPHEDEGVVVLVRAARH
jgi:hypothetical protein